MNSRSRLIAGVLAIGLAVLALVGCSRKPKTAEILAKASAAYTTGDLEAAKFEYTNVLRIDPKERTAIEQLGQIWLDQGDQIRALPFLAKTVELDPQDNKAKVKLAKVMISIDRPAAAKKLAKEVLERSKENEEALLVLAESVQNADDVTFAETTLTKHRYQFGGYGQMAAAVLAMRRGEAELAGAALRRAVSAEPKLPVTHLALAEFLMTQKNTTEAAREFKSAAELAPARSTARLKYADFLVNTGKRKDAIAYVEKLTTEVPDYLPAWRLLAFLALVDKRYDDATALLQKALKIDPTSYDAQMLQAQVLYARGEQKKGIELLEEVGKSYPNLPADKYLLARYKLQQHDVAAATALLRRTVELDRENVDAAIFLAQLYMNAGHAEPVVDGMIELLTRHPEQVRAQALLIDALRLTGRLDDAVSVLREQIRVYPKAAPSYYILGLVLRQQNKLPEARTNLEKSLELGPDQATVVNALVEIDFAEKKFADAVQRARKLMIKLPNSPEAQFLVGKTYAAKGEWDQAEIALEKAMDMDPHSAQVADLLVFAYIARRDVAPKLKQLEEAATQHPNDVRTLHVLAVIYLRAQKFDAARDVYEKLVALEPTVANNFNDLAYLYAEKFNQLDKGYELARKAYEIDPNLPQIADTLGWIHYRREQYAEAFELLKQAAKKMPNDLDAQYHFGKAAQKTGDIESQRVAFERVANAKDHPAKEEAKKVLAELPPPTAPAASAVPLMPGTPTMPGMTGTTPLPTTSLQQAPVVPTKAN